MKLLLVLLIAGVMGCNTVAPSGSLRREEILTRFDRIAAVEAKYSGVGEAMFLLMMSESAPSDTEMDAIREQSKVIFAYLSALNSLIPSEDPRFEEYLHKADAEATALMEAILVLAETLSEKPSGTGL